MVLFKGISTVPQWTFRNYCHCLAQPADMLVWIWNVHPRGSWVENFVHLKSCKHVQWVCGISDSFGHDKEGVSHHLASPQGPPHAPLDVNSCLPPGSRGLMFCLSRTQKTTEQVTKLEPQKQWDKYIFPTFCLFYLLFCTATVNCLSQTARQDPLPIKIWFPQRFGFFSTFSNDVF